MAHTVTLKKALALLLAASSSINSSKAVVRPTPLPSPVQINSPLLELFDGLVDIGATTLIGAKFYALQHGQGAERKGLISFKQEMHTLEEMVEIEQNFSTLKRSQPEAKSAHLAIKKALEEAIAVSLEISKIYRGLRADKDSLVSIIEQWLKQRKKDSTLLKSWAKLGEHHFATSIRSFAMLKSFIDDLQVFLRDIKQSCPKSKDFFEAELKKRQHG